METTMEQRLTAASCYFPFIGAVAAVYVRVTSPGDDYVRAHALQALALHFATYALGFLVGALGVAFVNTLFVVLTVGLMLFLAYRTYSGDARPLLPAWDEGTRDLAYAQMVLIGAAGFTLRIVVGRDAIGFLIVLAWVALIALLAYQANRVSGFALPGLLAPTRRLLSF